MIYSNIIHLSTTCMEHRQGFEPKKHRRSDNINSLTCLHAMNHIHPHLPVPYPSVSLCLNPQFQTNRFLFTRDCANVFCSSRSISSDGVKPYKNGDEVCHWYTYHVRIGTSDMVWSLSPQTVAWLSSIIHRQRGFTPFRMISNAPFIGTCLLVTSSPLVTTRYWSKDKRWSLSCGSCHRKHPWQLKRHHSASVQLWKKSCTSWFSSFGSLSHYLRSLYIPKKCMISSINRTCIDLYDVSASGHGWFKQGLEEKLAILWRRYCNHVILLHVLFDEQWLFSQVSIWKSTALSPLSLSYSVRNLTIPFESLESFHFSTPSIQRAPHTCFEWVRPRRHSPKSAINHVMRNRIAWFCIAGGRLQVQVQLIRKKNMYFRQISARSFKGSMYELPMALQFPTYFQSLAKDRKPIARPSPAHQVVKMILLISEEFLVSSCGM